MFFRVYINQKSLVSHLRGVGIEPTTAALMLRLTPVTRF
jgi:hypothetical protein